MVRAESNVYQTYRCPVLKRKRTRPVRRFRRLKLAMLVSAKRKAEAIWRGVA